MIKTYLGDSVYAGRDEYGNVEVWLDNGDDPFSVIVLEPAVQMRLKAFIDEGVQACEKEQTTSSGKVSEEKPTEGDKV